MRILASENINILYKTCTLWKPHVQNKLYTSCVFNVDRVVLMHYKIIQHKLPEVELAVGFS